MNTNLTTSNRLVSLPLETFKQSRNNLFEPQLETAAENKITDPSTLSIIKDPIVKAEALDKIPFAIKPLPQGGEIVYLTPAEFQEKFGCTYSESLHGNKEELSAYLGNEKLYKALQNVELSEPRLKDVYYRLNNPLQSAVICDMGEVGYGLFASKDIAPGTVLFMYSGQVEIVGKQSIQDYYASSWLLGIDLKDKQFQQLQAKNVNPLISSAKVGNLSRFMQHLPSSLDNELGDIIFTDKNSLNAIATNNVQFCTMIINNTPTLVCWTENGIEKHEQIGFSYGRNYWNFGSREPLYFDKMGAVIPTHSYTYKSNLIRAKRLNLYRQGLRDYEAARYIRAIQTIEGALLTEKTINQFFEQDNAFYANGFFTLAYCYLKLNNIAIATRSFEKA
ncbi:MAG: SET domain-containing protein-lysine N-methyltransferase, partial [Burkholderiales bacterium]